MKCDRTFHEAIVQLTKEQYSRKILKTLLGFCTSDVGFRLGGSTAEHKASEYLLQEFHEIGLQNVHLEEIPTAACEYTGAYVLVNGASEGVDQKGSIKKRKLIGSQITGFPCTGPDGVKAPVVYVGKGHRADYDAISTDPDYFRGKLVMIDSSFDTLWVNWQAAEAKARGASGIILTVETDLPPGGYFSYAPDMIAGQDGMSLLDFPPLVFISQQDGNWLKTYIKRQESSCETECKSSGGDIEMPGMIGQMSFTAPEDGDEGNVVTIVSNGTITRPEDGGVGYNVLGQITGHGEPEKMVLICAHQDAHLFTAADDTGAVAAVTMLAKAMMMSGYKPYYTVQFLLTSSEEYGVCDTAYDWQHGMFVAMKSHPDWPGRIVGVLNNEVMAEKGGFLDAIASCDAAGFVRDTYEQIAKDCPELAPNGASILPVMITIGDEWTTAASGIPSIDMTCKRHDYLSRYHSNYDSEDNIDYDLLAKTTEVIGMMAKALDEEPLPWSVGARADNLKELYLNPDASGPAAEMVHSMTKEAVIIAGVNHQVAEDLEIAILEYAAEAEKFESRRCQMTAGDFRQFNYKLLQIIKKTLKSFTALSVQQSTVYPYQQTLSNLLGIKETIEALEEEAPDRNKILEAMGHINEVEYGYFSFTRNAELLSRSAYEDMLKLFGEHEDDWSSLGKLSPIVDLYDQYYYVKDEEHTDFAPVTDYLKKQRDLLIIELETRLQQMADNLKELAAMIREA